MYRLSKARVVLVGLLGGVGAVILTPTAGAATLSYTGFTVTGDPITLNTPHSGSRGRWRDTLDHDGPNLACDAWSGNSPGA